MSAVRRGVALLAPVVLVALSALVAASPAAADTAWGNTGAFYGNGIVCRLDGNTIVPMATWDVDGTSAFSTADISARGDSYGNAPSNGPSSPIQPGDAGLDSGEIAATAYLIAHHGSASGAQIAEVSADVATAAGGGTVQSRCLGQHGTSRSKASALFAEAQRYAGPYKVSLDLPTHAQPGKQVAIGARVTSALGYGTPGITVTFSVAVAGGSATAVTGNDGTARTLLTTPSAPATPIIASIAEPISLTYFATEPSAVADAAPTSVTTTGTLAPVLHPTPKVTTQATGLVLRNGTITPHATVTGTFGYAGTGSIALRGPLQPAHDANCSSITSSAFGKATTAWQGNFGFVGDGTHDAGRTPHLAAGCYAVTSSITTTNTNPKATATSGYGTSVQVSDLALSESTGPGVAPTGALAATVRATGATGAKVKTSITVHGPLTPRNGVCSTDLDWNQAPIRSVSDAVSLTAGGAGTTTGAGTGDDDLAAVIKSPDVGKVGCYALASRSIVTQNGQTIVVEPSVGKQGTTVLVAAPSLAIDDGDYDGEIGKPMTGTITVVGSYKYPGTLTVGLTSVAQTDVGCRGATFPPSATTQQGPVVTSSTAGDGVVRFRTPPPGKNRCYAVTAVLRLKANPAVQATSPAPSTSSVFLAGVVLRTPTISGTAGTDRGALAQTAIAAGISLLVLFVVAFIVIGRAYARRGPRPA